MILTTTPTVQGREIRQYHGVVVGEAILAQTSSKIFLPVSVTLLADVPGLMKQSWPKREKLHSMNSKSRPEPWAATRLSALTLIMKWSAQWWYVDGQHQWYRGNTG